VKKKNEIELSQVSISIYTRIPIATTYKLRLSLQVPVRVERKLEQRGACNCLAIVHTIRIGCNEEIDNAAQTVRNADALPSIVKGYDDGLLATQERAI